MKKILCLIPARSGSKSLPHKNIKFFNGKPLLAWSIIQAKQSKYNMRIIVSTDSIQYADIAKKYDAETPFLRPDEISGDQSTDLECFQHTLNWLEHNENYIPDIVLHLRPTQPLRKVKDIDECLDIFIENFEKYESLRSVVEFEKSPYKMYQIDKYNKQLKPLFKNTCGFTEPFNQCRQCLNPSYIHNGYIDIMKPSLLKDGLLSGDKIYPYLMDKSETHDIDTWEDWERAEKISNVKLG